MGTRSRAAQGWKWGSARPLIDGDAARLGGRVGEVAGAVAEVEGVRGGAGNGDADAMEVDARGLVAGVVADEVLGTQVVADLGEGLVEAAGAGVEALAAGLLGE